MEITEAALDARASFLLGLTQDDVDERRGYIGASDANVILSGDAAKVHALWQVKRGDAEPEDLSDVLAVQMGTWTEELNLYWYARQTGHVVAGRRSKLVHPTAPYVRATLDGRTVLPSGQRVIVEAKHVGPFSYSKEKTAERYAPQLAVQMACAGAEIAHLSIFSGNSVWELAAVERDPLYEDQVMAALAVFWRHVKDGTPPVDLPAPKVLYPVELLRKVDLSTNNAWVASEEDYLANEQAASLFESAKATLKGLVEDDVGEAKGRRLKVSRSKNGALRFSRVK